VRRLLGTTLVLLASASGLRAQALKPGFDKAEYLKLLRLHVRMSNPDSLFWAGIPQPRQFRLAYRLPVVGLDNRWELWAKAGAQPQAVISIRGTTQLKYLGITCFSPITT
jgi:hypothetical protein